MIEITTFECAGMIASLAPPFPLDAIIGVCILGIVSLGISFIARANIYPEWLQTVLIVLIVLSLFVFYCAWHEEKFFTGFVGWYLTIISLALTFIIPFYFGKFIGKLVYRRSKMKFLGFLIGLLIFFFLGVAISRIVTKIPGVEKRIMKVFDNEENWKEF